MADERTPAAPLASGTAARTQVTRTVDLDAGPDAVWSVVADPDRRGDWLDDPDAGARTIRIDQVDAGRRLAWTWWPAAGHRGRPGDGSGTGWRDEGDEGAASTVELTLRPLDGGGTRVVVTETLAAALPPATASAPEARATTVAVAHGATAAVAGRAARHGLRWDRRLLGLELMFVGVLAGVR